MSEITGWRWVPLDNAALVTGDLPDEFRLIAVMPNHMCAVTTGSYTTYAIARGKTTSMNSLRASKASIYHPETIPAQRN